MHLVKAVSSSAGSGETSGLVEIATATPSGGTLTFSSIPSTYTHLRIVARMRTDEAAIASIIRLRVGSGSIDSGASSYAYGYFLNRIGTGNMTGVATAAAEIRQVLCPGGNATSGFFGTAVIDIFNYADTSANRQIRIRSEDVGNGTFGHIGGATGMWLNTADAIDTVRLFDDTGDNLVSGSQAWLYGVGDTGSDGVDGGSLGSSSSGLVDGGGL